MELNDYEYGDILIGKVFEFEKVLAIEDLDSFAKLTGDYNPLHCDEEYSKSKGFENRVVYGMLAGSLFSTLVGMICPGKRNLYLTQSLNFKRPLYPGEKLIVRGEIVGKNESINILTIKTKIISGGLVAIEGVAKVKVV